MARYCGSSGKRRGPSDILHGAAFLWSSHDRRLGRPQAKVDLTIRGTEPEYSTPTSVSWIRGSWQDGSRRPRRAGRRGNDRANRSRVPTTFVQKYTVRVRRGGSSSSNAEQPPDQPKARRPEGPGRPGTAGVERSVRQSSSTTRCASLAAGHGRGRRRPGQGGLAGALGDQGRAPHVPAARSTALSMECGLRGIC